MTDPAEQAAGEAEGLVSRSLVRCVEALLMAADDVVTVAQLVDYVAVFEDCDRAMIERALTALSHRYSDSALELVSVAGGWRFQVSADYSRLIGQLWEARPPKLSRAMLEILALICYRQPIARSDIEAVRGVSVSSQLIRTLESFEWIRVVGHRDVPGRPALFGTTHRFLADFGVSKLTDLPPLVDVQETDALDRAVAQLQNNAAAGPSDNDGQPETDPDRAGLESDPPRPNV